MLFADDVPLFLQAKKRDANTAHSSCACRLSLLSGTGLKPGEIRWVSQRRGERKSACDRVNGQSREHT